jgi:NADH-quinone oxidoreductase subunit G
VNLTKNYLGIGDFYLAGNPKGDGDEILRHVDKNPNTLGATQTASTTPPGAFAQLLKKIESGEITHVLALGSAVPVEAQEALNALNKLKELVTVGVWEGPLAKASTVFLPACSHAESEGTFTNAKGISQRSERALEPFGESQPAWSIFARIGETLGHPTSWKKLKDIHKAMAPEAGAVASATAEP